ncbi:hypothetical protein HMPREF9098_0871 [Kingella denitrificans ATCC 33394]|uniref:Uncharacterized protein n=1 Tax=Kingella denitrificans ATCC 33394 TaxID=888741 RepID=F0EYD7_9NEIS|nr:hypothetical protein HMPREF9098_0871 [Kingella denitrificans ATCC 33394]
MGCRLFLCGYSTKLNIFKFIFLSLKFKITKIYLDNLFKFA